MWDSGTRDVAASHFFAVIERQEGISATLAPAGPYLRPGRPLHHPDLPRDMPTGMGDGQNVIASRRLEA